MSGAGDLDTKVLKLADECSCPRSHGLSPSPFDLVCRFFLLLFSCVLIFSSRGEVTDHAWGWMDDVVDPDAWGWVDTVINPESRGQMDDVLNPDVWDGWTMG